MHQTSNFNSQCIFYVIFFFIFYHDNAHFKKQYFIKPCLFHWGYKPWEYWPIGSIMSFPMGLYSIGVINHAFSVGSKFLGIVFHIALVWLCSTSEWLHAVQLFFTKASLFSKIVYWNLAKYLSRKLIILIIIYSLLRKKVCT